MPANELIVAMALFMQVSTENMKASQRQKELHQQQQLELQQQTRLEMQALTQATKQTLPNPATPALCGPISSSAAATPLPFWDGRLETFKRYNTKLLLILKSATYRSVTDFTVTTPSDTEIYLQLCTEFHNVLPEHIIKMFEGNSKYDYKGFETYGRLLEKFSPYNTIAVFTMFIRLHHIQMDPTESIASYMAKSRDVVNFLSGNTINQLASLFLLMGIDDTRFGELNEEFKKGNIDILKTYLDNLELRLDNFESPKMLIDGEESTPQPPIGSANRSNLPTKPVPKAAPGDPTPRERRPRDDCPLQPYPPPGGIS